MIEGEGPQFVTLRSLVPARLFCPLASRHDCDVHIGLLLRPGKEKKCYDGTEITQAVFPWLGNAYPGLGIVKSFYDIREVLI